MTLRKHPGDPEPAVSRAAQDERGGPLLPIRATAIVLSVWVTVLVLAALFVVPALFANCAPPPAQ